MLGDEDVGPLGHVLQQSAHEVHGPLGIAFCVFAGYLRILDLAAEADVVHADHQVLAEPESPVGRAEVIFVCCFGSLAAHVLDKVVVADHGIKRYSGLGYGFLVGLEYLELVPALVAEGYAHGVMLGQVCLSLLSKVLERLLAELLQVPFVLHLGVRYCKQREIVAVCGAVQFEVILLCLGKRLVELRGSRAEVRLIPGRANDIHETCVIGHIQLELSIGIGLCEVCAVGNDHSGKGFASAGDATAHAASLRAEAEARCEQ